MKLRPGSILFSLAMLGLASVLALLVWLLPTRSSSPSSQPERPGAAVRQQPLQAPPQALQSVLRQLASSRDASHPVRILFYGQSITEQGWWQQTVAFLRATYPQAVLQVENRAIGGHSASLLVKTAEADVYPFQPDLVIFHVYGSHRDYEAIIRAIRERTTADILIGTDHVTADEQLREETNPTRLWLRTLLFKLPGLVSDHERDANWAAWFNNAFLPDLASRYGVQLADVRGEWKRHLTANHIPATDLLRDDVHLNAKGQSLMSRVIENYLRPEGLLASSQLDDRMVEFVPPVKQVDAGSLRVQFKGTRLDALTDAQFQAAPLRVDGAPPCRLPAAVQFGRVSAYPGSNWPSLLRVQRGTAALLPETWTAVITKEDDDLNHFTFVVSGSSTGADGSGVSNERFVSNSGRVVIDPSDWDLAYARQVIKTSVPARYQISWKSECHGTDTLMGESPGGAPVTLVEGLANGSHTLELPADAARHLTALRAYRPLSGRD